jgi:hypothetical protein
MKDLVKVNDTKEGIAWIVVYFWQFLKSIMWCLNNRYTYPHLFES